MGGNGTAMDDIEILHQIIKDKAKVWPTKCDSDSDKSEPKNTMKVRLDEPLQRGSFIDILGLPVPAIILKVDTFKAPDDIFAGTKGESRRADFVIVTGGDKKVIIYIEMKAGKKGNIDSQAIIQQLKGAKCFMTYCREIGQTFWDKKDFLSEYKHRFLAVIVGKGGKRGTRMKPYTDGIITRKDTQIINVHRELHFKKLVGKGKNI